MFRFTIRDVLWLTVVIALSTVIVHDRWAASVAPLVLDGYCPVTLVRDRQWRRGDPQCQTLYQGRKYLFASKTEQELFQAAPTRFVPVYGGNDPVRHTDEKRESPGYRSYGLTFNARIYLFDSEESLHKFAANPAPYVQR
jgi:YHS domain.